MLGSHTGGLVGSLPPSIHNHLSAATNIAAKANVGGTAEKNHISNVATGNSQCYISTQGSMVNPYQKQAELKLKGSHQRHNRQHNDGEFTSLGSLLGMLVKLSNGIDDEIPTIKLVLEYPNWLFGCPAGATEIYPRCSFLVLW